jgi:hypothetical protein
MESGGESSECFKPGDVLNVCLSTEHWNGIGIFKGKEGNDIYVRWIAVNSLDYYYNHDKFGGSDAFVPVSWCKLLWRPSAPDSL